VITDTTVVAQFKVLSPTLSKEGLALIGIKAFGLDSLPEEGWGEIYFPTWTTLDFTK
jgi:isoleucyl-tRNA synthetase